MGAAAPTRLPTPSPSRVPAARHPRWRLGAFDRAARGHSAAAEDQADDEEGGAEGGVAGLLFSQGSLDNIKKYYDKKAPRFHGTRTLLPVNPVNPASPVSPVNPEPETRNPKTETRNPKPET